MTNTIRDIAYQLRQGQLIALADETGWSVAADPTNDAAVGQLLVLRKLLPNGLQPTVVIQNTDQLVLYVAKMPDIAYDLVEFAENPLVVLFEQGKNVSPKVWQAEDAEPAANGTPMTGELAVRRTLGDDVQRLIGNLGRGLLTIPFESLNLPPDAEKRIVARFGTLPGMPRRARIVRLKVNGEFDFIRK